MRKPLLGSHDRLKRNHEDSLVGFATTDMWSSGMMFDLQYQVLVPICLPLPFLALTERVYVTVVRWLQFVLRVAACAMLCSALGNVVVCEKNKV